MPLVVYDNPDFQKVEKILIVQEERREMVDKEAVNYTSNNGVQCVALRQRGEKDEETETLDENCNFYTQKMVIVVQKW